jgi:hypothetical protein
MGIERPHLIRQRAGGRGPARIADGGGAGGKEKGKNRNSASHRRLLILPFRALSRRTR